MITFMAQVVVIAGFFMGCHGTVTHVEQRVERYGTFYLEGQNTRQYDVYTVEGKCKDVPFKAEVQAEDLKVENAKGKEDKK